MVMVSEQSPKTALSFLLAANFLSWLGNAVSLVAVPLFVLAKTGSPFQTGIAGFANTVPILFAGMTGGVLADHFGGKRVSVASDLLAGIATMCVPLLQNSLVMAALYVLLFVRGLANSSAGIAKISQLRGLSDAAGVRLETANTLLLGAPTLALVLGTPAAALLVSVIGPAQTQYVDAGSFLIAALLVFLGVSAPTRPSQARGTPSFARQLLEGLAFMRTTSVIRAIFAVLLVTNFTDPAFAAVLYPVYARNVIGDPRVVGWLLAAGGVGSVLGTLLYAPASRRILTDRRATFLGLFAVLATLRVAMTMLPGWQVMAAMTFCVGLGTGPLNTLLVTVLQEWIPGSLRGRVLGLTHSFTFSAAPLGILVAGWSSGALGLRYTLMFIAGLYLVVVFVAYLSPSLAHLNRRTETESQDG